MSSTSHLTVAPTSEAKNEQQKSSYDSRNLRCGGSSNLLRLSSSPTTNSKYLYYVNVEPTRKSSATTTALLTTTAPNSSGKINTIALPVPWYKRARSPSDEKAPPKAPKMSRDRLLPLDKLFHNNALVGTLTTTTDEDQASPINDLTPLDEAIKFNEKNMQQIKENGCINNSSHVMTR